VDKTCVVSRSAFLYWFSGLLHIVYNFFEKFFLENSTLTSTKNLPSMSLTGKPKQARIFENKIAETLAATEFH
jgi:hypothetical protein